MACWIASSSTSATKGFVRNSTAPAFIARTVVGTSAWPVTKMIGMSARSATSFCRSQPLRSGRTTSSTRQLGPCTRGRDRNSCADPNVSGCQPADSMSSFSDSRTEASSSTTNTVGLASDMRALHSCQGATPPDPQYDAPPALADAPPTDGRAPSQLSISYARVSFGQNRLVSQSPPRTKDSMADRPSGFVVAVVDDDQGILRSLEIPPGIRGLRRAPVYARARSCWTAAVCPRSIA